MRTIIQLSDLHFGRHDAKIADDLLASVNGAHPDLTVFSGDFTQRATAAQFAEAHDFVARVAGPKIAIPGNHDVPLYDILGRILHPLDNYRRFIAPLAVADNFYADAEMAVFGVNTARRFAFKNGRVSFAQMDDIDARFRAVPPHLFKILVSHHPLGFPDGASALDLAGRSRHALKVLAERDVHLMLSGHGHRAVSGEMAFETAAQRSILTIHAGTAISTRVRGGHGNSYNLIRIDGASLALTVREWSQYDGFRDCSNFSYRLQAGGWSRTTA